MWILDPVTLGDLYRTMARIRCFEEAVAERFRGGDIHGFVHVSIGQEAVAAGVCSELRSDDVITTTHRGHGHCIAKGADLTGMMAELFGRETGLCRGRGGSMHLADPSLGIIGANGIVGAGVPLAAGAALTFKLRGPGRLAVAFFGEGAVHTGAFHEGVTLAVAWSLPVVFVCENNGWAEFTPTGRWGGPSVVERAASYGLASLSVDGNDVLAVASAFAELGANARAGAGAALLEARTSRWSGHYEGDPQRYRVGDAPAAGSTEDPLVVARTYLGDDDHADRLEHEALEEVATAIDAALAAPLPTPGGALEGVYA